jgi:hypothetical protein
MIARLSGDECAFSNSGEGGARRRKKATSRKRRVEVSMDFASKLSQSNLTKVTL